MVSQHPGHAAWLLPALQHLCAVWSSWALLVQLVPQSLAAALALGQHCCSLLCSGGEEGTPLMGLKEQRDNTLSLQGILPCGAEQPTAALRAELPLHSARAQGWVLVAQSLMKTPEGK